MDKKCMPISIFVLPREKYEIVVHLCLSIICFHVMLNIPVPYLFDFYNFDYLMICTVFCK